MLDNARVATRLPTQDLERARRWYSEKLGLEPAEERPGGLLYRFSNGEFALYGSAGASPGTFHPDGIRGRGQLPEQGRQGRACRVVP